VRKTGSAQAQHPQQDISEEEAGLMSQETIEISIQKSQLLILHYHESVILQKTSLKDLILIIKSTYQS
jgi:hypothetical protein